MTSTETKDFRDMRLRALSLDEMRINGGEAQTHGELEIQDLQCSVMELKDLFEPIVKPRNRRGSIKMEVTMDLATQYDLKGLARSIGVKSWKHLLLIRLAIKMKERK